MVAGTRWRVLQSCESCRAGGRDGSHLGDSPPPDLITGLELARLPKTPSEPEEFASAFARDCLCQPITAPKLLKASKTSMPEFPAALKRRERVWGISSATSVELHNGRYLFRANINYTVLGKL